MSLYGSSYSSEPECFGEEYEDGNAECGSCVYGDSCRKQTMSNIATRSNSHYSRYGNFRSSYAKPRKTTTMRKYTRPATAAPVPPMPQGNVQLGEVHAPESGEFFGELMSSMVSTVGHTLGDYFQFRRFRFNRNLPQGAPTAITEGSTVEVPTIKPGKKQAVPCPGCRTPINPDYLFCPECGEEVA